jgi:phosphopantothenoylcysteine decarboxylase/phosphopantothenate--cysteine ligase
LVTAGPTHEKIDPVRFIGNYSSGKMGYAICEQLAQQGAKVKLVTGPTSLKTEHPNIERINVTSAEEMYNAANIHFPNCNGAILAAAVADFTPENVADKKVKRGKDDLVIRLKPTRDIAACLGANKKPDQFMVGFALETHDESQNAQRKLAKKKLDFIVLNSLNDKGAGFQVDTNKITILDKDNNQQCFELKSKTEVAIDIVDRIILDMEKQSLL